MRRSAKIKVAVARVPLRKAVSLEVPLSVAPRRAFPAWIDSAEGGLAVSATPVTPRVRDGLVLRVVSHKKPVAARSLSHGAGAR